MPRCRFIAGLVAGGMLWVASAGLTVSAQAPPTLQLVASNQTAQLIWPSSAYYFLLQSKFDLTSTNAWVNEACASPSVAAFSRYFRGGSAVLATNVTTNGLAFAQSKLPVPKFYRLKTPDLLPLCSFAIFYDGLMEFSQCATMVVNGMVHANGSIYVGTTAALTFNSPVSCTGMLSAPLMDGITTNWTPTNPATWNVNFNGNPPVISNMLAFPLWTFTNGLHAVIDLPPAGENPNTLPGVSRLYNQAQMVLVVTNDVSGSGNPTVHLALLQSINATVPGNDPSPLTITVTNASPASLTTNFPFLSLTNLFFDQRERKTNLVTQIDVGWFANWTSTNVLVQGKLPASSGEYPTLFYIADQRNHSPYQLPVVRLSNGAQLPSNGGLGFSVATPNPLYVWGNYNVQIASSAANASAGTTNTANTVPAALFSDSLTVLSSHWTDLSSFTIYAQTPSFQAVDDTINAVIFSGNMPSTDNTGTGFSGGVHNFPRLLENWSGANLWLNTSLCRLWTSQMATNQFRNPYGFNPAPVNPYYNPPTRHFAFDPNFLNLAKIPPGVPVMVFSTNGTVQ